MTEKILLRGGSILKTKGIKRFSSQTKKSQEEIESSVQDIRIEDGVIVELNKTLKPAANETVIEADGLWIVPGFIDLQTQLCDFDQASAEDIASGTKAAAAGGFTTVTAMADTVPPIDSSLILHRLLQLIKEKSCVRVLPVATLTKNLEGRELTNMFELAAIGAAAFSDAHEPVKDSALLKRALENAKILNRLIISHPEDKQLSAGGVINESGAAARLGLPAIPAVAEAAAVAREIELVRATDTRLHFSDISTAAALRLIRQAKEDGLPITAHVTPHHLLLCDSEIKTFDTNLKVNPPLRSSTDRESLIAAIADGTIDAIATSHSPSEASAKLRPFVDASFGIIGLETAFALLYDRLVLTKQLSMDRLLSLLTDGPAAVMQLRPPKIGVGEAADLAVINPSEQWCYDASKRFSKSSNSPFLGETFTTKIVLTIASGTIVFRSPEFRTSETIKKTGAPASITP